MLKLQPTLRRQQHQQLLVQLSLLQLKSLLKAQRCDGVRGLGVHMAGTNLRI